MPATSCNYLCLSLDSANFRVCNKNRKMSLMVRKTLNDLMSFQRNSRKKGGSVIDSISSSSHSILNLLSLRK